MSDSPIHYALLLLPALWFACGGAIVLWKIVAFLLERRPKAPPPVPAWPNIGAAIEAGRSMKETPDGFEIASEHRVLPRLDDVVPPEGGPPSKPEQQGHTKIGLGPPTR